MSLDALFLMFLGGFAAGVVYARYQTGKKI